MKQEIAALKKDNIKLAKAKEQHSATMSPTSDVEQGGGQQGGGPPRATTSQLKERMANLRKMKSVAVADSDKEWIDMQLQQISSQLTQEMPLPDRLKVAQ